MKSVTRTYKDVAWERTEQRNFIFERDEIAYGVEVKNTLGYMNYEEFVIKIALCEEIGIRPVLMARMLPKS
jgi:hypothetical protein